MLHPLETLASSRALWNRKHLDLDSDEILAQILDRGSLEDWRALHALISTPDVRSAGLKVRIHRLLMRVPIGRPYFWLAALAGLGFAVDWSQQPHPPCGEADI